MRKTAIVFSLLLMVLQVQAQDMKKVEWSMSAEPLHAWLWAHSKDIAFVSGTTGTGFQLCLNRLRLDETAYSYAHQHYNSGFSFQYMHFSNPLIGNAYNLAYFMEPLLIETPKFSLRLKAAGGINYASNPYNANTKDSVNAVYSSHINGYLALGLSAHFKLNKSTGIFATATYSHFSNGNTKNPNYGANFPNIGLGLNYTIKTTQKPIGKLLFYKERWRYDFTVFGSNKSLTEFKTMRFFVYGVNAQVSYRSGKIHGWTAGAEVFNDLANKYYIEHRYWFKTLNSVMAGTLLGHEFLLNRCIFSQQLGFYFFKENPEFIRVYHRWGFSYKLNKNFRVGLNLNASLQKAYIFDARLTYSIYH